MFNFQIFRFYGDFSIISSNNLLDLGTFITLRIVLSIFDLVISVYSAASLSRQYRKTFEVLRGIKQSEIGLEVRKEIQSFEIELLNDKIEIGAYSLFELSSSYGYLVRSSSLVFVQIFMILEFLSDAGCLSRFCNSSRPVSSVATKWKLSELIKFRKNLDSPFWQQRTFEFLPKPWKILNIFLFVSSPLHSQSIDDLFRFRWKLPAKLMSLERV